MRTAVCLSGQPRDIKETWKSFYDYLLKNLPNPDVFVYTSESYDVRSDFFELVKPMAYLVEPQFQHTQMEKFLSRIGFYAEHRINPTIQQFYGMRRVWDLKTNYEQESGVKYDLIVRTRPDFIYLRPITLDFLDLTRFNNLHAAHAPTMSTEIAFGPDEVMGKYFKIYDWLAGDGQKYLTKNNPRLDYPPDHKYNCDVLMVSYFKDYLREEIAPQRLLKEAPCPYDYYRIMTRHKKGEYLK